MNTQWIIFFGKGHLIDAREKLIDADLLEGKQISKVILS